MSRHERRPLMAKRVHLWNSTWAGSGSSRQQPHPRIRWFAAAPADTPTAPSAGSSPGRQTRTSPIPTPATKLSISAVMWVRQAWSAFRRSVIRWQARGAAPFPLPSRPLRRIVITPAGQITTDSNCASVQPGLVVEHQRLCRQRDRRGRQRRDIVSRLYEHLQLHIGDQHHQEPGARPHLCILLVAALGAYRLQVRRPAARGQ